MHRLLRWILGVACAAFTAVASAAPAELTVVTITASDGAADDQFGRRVVIDADVLAVSADGQDGKWDDNSTNDYAGAVYVFTRAAGVWTQRAQLVPNKYTSDYGFATAVGGTTVAVSGRRLFPPVTYRRGVVDVFVQNGPSWSPQAELQPSDFASDNDAYEYFGSNHVAVDGDTIAVGARSSIYVFVRVGTTWTEQTKLPVQHGRIDLDGDTLVASSGTTVRVFSRIGSTWSEGPTLSIDGVAAVTGLAIDGDAMVVGGTKPVGRCDFFERSGGTWTKRSSYTGMSLGSGLSLSGDMAVSTGAASGIAVFVRTAGGWELQAYPIATDFGAATASSVALSGSTIVVGSFEEAPYVGAALVLEILRFNPIAVAAARDVLVGSRRPFYVAPPDVPGTAAMTWETIPTPNAWLDPATGSLSGNSSVRDNRNLTLRGRDVNGAVAALASLRVHFADVVDLEIGAGSDTYLIGSDLRGTPQRAVRALELCRGTRVSLDLRQTYRDVKAKLGDVTMRIVDPSGGVDDLSKGLKRSKWSLSVPRFIAAQSGRHFVQIDADNLFRPNYDEIGLEFTVRVVAPTSFKGGGQVPAAGPLTAVVGTLPGAFITFDVKPAKGSKAAPTIVSVKGSDGEELLLPGDVRVRGKSARAKPSIPSPGGDVFVQIGAADGVAGACQWTASIKEPRGYLLVTPDEPSGDPK